VNTRKGLLGFIVLTLFVGLPCVATAQYCALRQPTVAFQEAFDDETMMRSFDRQVTEVHRDKIAEVLPFTIHRNELGTHTLYAAIGDGNRVNGYIHVRSERGKWGLTELAWVLNPDLTVRTLDVQRCRSFSQSYLESGAFQTLVRDKSIADIRSLLVESGTQLHPDVKASVPDDKEALALMAVRSALKTLLATQLVWEDTLASLGYRRAGSIFDGSSVK